jgi:threonyl-tRNA synthetase
VQIDVESAVRFDISYIKGDQKIQPPILHCSPTGSIERVICALLEGTAHQEVPSLPCWLSPTQVRIIPVAARHVPWAEQICEQLNTMSMRVDLDDRDESVNKKIRQAGVDWVPFVAVIGDREMEENLLTVTIRKRSQAKKPYREEMSVERLAALVREEQAGKPYRPLYTAKRLSRKVHYI